MSAAGSFRFVDAVTSDLSFIARGRSLEDLFSAAAEALVAATVENPDAVEPRTARTLQLADTELDLLLMRFLNELIFLRDAEGLVLRPRALRFERNGAPRLEAELVGETLDPTRHRLADDVKAATAHGLRVAQTDEGWEASVTLDV
jgi:SHS2 domain-containing protein